MDTVVHALVSPPPGRGKAAEARYISDSVGRHSDTDTDSQCSAKFIRKTDMIIINHQ
jgi:hypothetical protein